MYYNNHVEIVVIFFSAVGGDRLTRLTQHILTQHKYVGSNIVHHVSSTVFVNWCEKRPLIYFKLTIIDGKKTKNKICATLRYCTV